METPADLAGLIQFAPESATALLIPETGTRVTYGSLRQQVYAMAGKFSGLGIGRKDRVAITTPNGAPAVVSFLAASLAGTAAPLNPNYRYDEFKFFLEDTAARILVTTPDGSPEARRAAVEAGIPVVEIVEEAPGRFAVIEGETAPLALLDPEDIALVLHTSGSTGRPKRVPISHRNLGVSARNICDTYELSGSDVTLCVMPLFHVHGLVASTLSTLLSGGTVVVPAKFNPLSFWRTVREQKVTWYSAVPTIHQLAMARAGATKPAGLEALRFVRSCSSALPVDLGRRIEALLEVPVLEAYGMTEAAHQMASNPLPPNERKLGSVGPGTGVSIGIIDESGNHLPNGQTGQVVIQGANVVREYESNPEATAASFVGGWFRTGDQGVLDENGYLRITGRLKEMINRGGEKISPVEIDELLLLHPNVAEAVTFGVAHPSWGEEVAAAVVLRESCTESEIIAWCKDRISEFKAPKKIYVVEAIPRTATGKIQRMNVAKALVE